MSGCDQSSSIFYNPETSVFYGNYGQDLSQVPGEITFLTPDFIELGSDEYLTEPPLLEELGINPNYIIQKTMTVLNPFRTATADVAKDSDLAGPLVSYFDI